MVVQHNMQAMNANRMLGVTSGQQAKSTEKLSSGYRINRAADDAAGLSISEKMRKQIKGLTQASTNAQDGVSAVQTAEGALTEVHSMLQRMNELATQASNGTNSETDRDAIQAEIEQLTTEIDRVAETTKFNETYLLKGDDGTKTINLKAHDAGLKGTLVDKGDGTATFTMDALEVGGKVTIGGKEYTIGADAADVTAFVSANSAQLTTTAGNKFTVDGTEYTYYDSSAAATGKAEVKAGWYSAHPSTDANYGDSTKSVSTSVSDQAAASTKANGATKSVQIGANKINKVQDADSNGIDDNESSIITKGKAYELAAKELLAANQIGDTEGNAKVGVGAATTAVNLTNGTGTFEINVAKAETPETLSFNLHVGADADMTNKINVKIDSMNSSTLGIKGLNVSDDSGKAATYAIDAIADALQKVSEQRSSLGAVQNRLEHTIANVDNVVENTTSAESRIRDTDMASEMVNYSKNNILAQAGQSMLAQANQSTQGVLSLLG